MITTHSALIYAMVLSAAADGSVDDEELNTISEIINVLPIFQDFEIPFFTHRNLLEAHCSGFLLYGED